MSLIAYQEGGFSLFYLFEIVYGTLQPFLGCHALFRVDPCFASNDVAECFQLQIYYKSASCRFTAKYCKRHYKVGQLKVWYQGFIQAILIFVRRHKKLNLLIEFSNSIFITFYFKTFWH